MRTLVETIAAAMGTLAHVAALRRLSLGPFAANGMVTMEQVEAGRRIIRRLDALLLPVDAGLEGLPAVELSNG